MLEYHNSLANQKPNNQIRNLFKQSSEHFVDLLEKLVQYNPAFRPSAKECLQLKMFDKVRNPAQEVEAPFEIRQQLFMPGVYDYEREIDLVHSMDDFRQMMKEEIKQVK